VNTPTKWRGSRAAAAVLAAGLAALAFATPAHAATPNLVDPDATGSLTIHKYEAPVTPTGLPNDGTEQTARGQASAAATVTSPGASTGTTASQEGSTSTTETTGGTATTEEPAPVEDPEQPPE
jgi:hypothetical protein